MRVPVIWALMAVRKVCRVRLTRRGDAGWREDQEFDVHFGSGS